MNRKLILYIAMSLDGYIAQDEDNVDFLSIVDAPPEDYGYADFTQNIDTVIWGRKTYDKLKSFNVDFPHKGKKVYIISRSKTGTEPHVEFVSDVKALVENLKQQEGKDIYCDGGAEIVFELLKYALIDKFVISVIPHLVGNGIRLFKDGRPEQAIKFLKSITYPTGLVQLWYEKKE